MTTTRNRASQRRINKYTHYATRLDLAQLHFSEIEDGEIIRSLNLPKWILRRITDEVPADLPRLTRSQLAHSAEELIPPKAVITHRQKPMWIMSEL